MQLDRKAHSLYKTIEELDYKKVNKNITKMIDSARSVVEELFYKTALGYLYDKSHKTVESKKLLDEILERILEHKVFDEFLVEHFMSICRELGYADMSVKLAEARYNNNPNDHNNAVQMFNTYVATNDFMKMNGTSSKIATTFSLPQYAVHSIQSLYMLSQSEGSPPNIIDLAYMFAKKHIDKFGDEDEIPPSEGKLYVKILQAKSMAQEALQFIEKHSAIYSGDLERARSKIDILKSHIEKASSNQGDVNELQEKLLGIVRDVIKNNYEKPQEFNCIYDLYEIMVQTLVDLAREQIKTQDLAELYSEIKLSEAKESEVFDLEQGGKGYNLESVKNLWRSLVFYQDFELENKTAEAHNLRKASVLSQLYLIHKMKFGETVAKDHEVFAEISLLYAKRYLHLSSLVYDLKGYMPYLTLDFINPLEAETESSLKGNKT